MKLNSKNKFDLKAGDILRGGHSWMITNIWTSTDKYHNPKSVSFTVRDLKDGRSIYGTPSSEWYGIEVDKPIVEYTGGNIWIAFLFDSDMRHYYAVSSMDIDAGNEQSLLYYDSENEECKFQNLVSEKSIDDCGYMEKIIHSVLLNAIKEQMN